MPNLVIVSNRLPVSVKKTNGKLEFSSSTGGLATGLSGYTNKRSTKWIGWPGLPSDDLTEADKAAIARTLKRQRCYPVFLTKKQIDEFYSGYSNGVLWPLFHNLPYTKHPVKEWQAYREVNSLYADEILRLSKPGSTIWVHDYQLMLVPQQVRQAGRGDTIGFFLHIPFPKVGGFEKLGEAKTLLRGMLGSDLVGFHTQKYTKRFLENCDKLLDTPSSNGRLLVGKRTVQATEFPIGIDYGRFAAATKQRTLRRQARQLRKNYPGQRVIVSVDRLDVTKGLVERIKAFQRLLEDHPKLAGKVTMVMVVAPSRTDVPEYQKLKERIDKALFEITDKFATAKWKPIDFRYEVVPLDEVMAYYQMADIAFIAPIVDGMNLVAKEFLASKRRNDGVLILSETAGAAEELRDAVLVNPKKPRTMVNGLVEALSMPRRELRRRAKHMHQQVKEFSAQKWADSFIETLQKPRAIKQIGVRTLSPRYEQALLDDYHQARSRLLLLDYDGVLQTFKSNPAEAKPTKEVLRLLGKLSKDATTDIMIISGRSKTDLQAWFGDLPIALAAEHGALIRRKGGKNWHRTSSSGLEWRKPVLELFERYAKLTPGALVEPKEWAAVWHYRAASAYYAQKNLVILRRLLKPTVKKYDLQILEGNKVLEVRPSDVSKRHAVQEWVISDHDFTLCIGDDVTDEDMFKAMPPQAYSIKVGRGPTKAHYRVKNVAAVLDLLKKL